MNGVEDVSLTEIFSPARRGDGGAERGVCWEDGGGVRDQGEDCVDGGGQ